MLLVSESVKELLNRERGFLSDLQAFLELQSAPAEAIAHVRTALTTLDEAFLLVVVGEFNAGKSSFVNALLGANVLPEGVTPTTDRIYVIVSGEKAGQLEPTSDPFVSRITYPLSSLEGVSLVDTPGTNAIIRQHQALTEGFLPRADLVLFLTSADRPFTESERQFLELSAQWGRSVIMVVNKADLLETAEQREQVGEFVKMGARGVLGLNPPVVLISARAEQRKKDGVGDAGFFALRELLKVRLSDKERTRLKLSSPMQVASELLRAEESRLTQARSTLGDDIKFLSELESQREYHRTSTLGELDGQLNRVGRLLSEFEVRADKFVDNKLQFRNIRSLLNSRELEEQFRIEAVFDLPEALDKQFGSMIDRFVESNTRFWEDVQVFLIKRQPSSEALHNRFYYDRAALIEGIGGSAKSHLETATQQHLARQLAQDAEQAVMGAVGGLAGGLLGGLSIGALIGATALDFTGGIIAGLALGSLGLFILPSKRLQAHRQLRSRVAELRVALESIVRREYEREQERADARLSDAFSPYTRFAQQEQTRLQESAAKISLLKERLEAIKLELS